MGRPEPGTQGESGSGAAPCRRQIPLASGLRRGELLRRVVDRVHMLDVFRRELPRWTDASIRVNNCSVKPAKSRKAFRGETLRIVYEVGVELEDGSQREYVFLGAWPVPPRSPESPQSMDAELAQRCRRLEGHPAVAPFRQLAAHLEDLQLGLVFFLLDPALPGLAEIMGAAGRRLLAPHLSECRRGEKIERIECELRRYNPFHRAVCRVRVELSAPGGGATQRTVYVKVFADERGAESQRELAALWSAARTASHLRVPEPLGYDAERRMLVMGEVAGERALTEWIKRVEQGLPLPAGVDLRRLERCLLVVAHTLRELQLSGVRPVERRSFQAALVPLRKDRDLLLRRAPPEIPAEILARLGALLARLEALAPLEEELVPAHGGFRHKQMVGDERSLACVDWDGLCQANAALDAATFLTRLRQEPLTNPGRAPELERLAEVFRRAFVDLRPAAGVHLALYEGLVLTEQALRSFRRSSRGDDTVDSIRNLAAAAERELDRFEARGTA